MRRAGRRQRIPGTQGRPDHRRHLSRGRHRHGRAARLQGLHPGREYRAYRRLDRRIGGRGRGVHVAGLRHGEGLGIVRFPRSLLEIDRAHAGGQRARRAVRLADPPRDGGRSRIAVPRIRGRERGPQGGTRHRQDGQVSLLQHRLRRRRVPCRRLRLLRAGSGLLLSHRAAGHERAASRSARFHEYDCHRRRHHGGRAQRQPGLHRRRLHHRTGTGGAQFFRQRDRLGPADSAVHLFPRTADSGLPAGGSDGRKLARPRHRHLALHRAPHRGGQHDGGHLLHAVPHAQEPDRRPGQSGSGTDGRSRSIRRPSAAPNVT